LLPGVGGDDPAEERARRLEVVVVAVDAPIREPASLVGGEDAGADRDVEPGRLAHERHGGENLAHDALVGAAYRENDAELRRADRGGLARRGEDLVGVEERRR